MVIELTDREVEFLGKLLNAVNLTGVNTARSAVSLANKIGLPHDPDGN